MDRYDRVEDWKVEFVAPQHYAIFHRQINLEWVDGLGENLCFETRRQAQQYLKAVLTKESKNG